MVITESAVCASDIRFARSRSTGKERDSESGNDYFEARYFASSMGRFLSPDDGSDQNAEDPQSWNLYEYVRNNPLINIDPDGHRCDGGGNGAYSQTFDGKVIQIIPGSTPDTSGCPDYSALRDLLYESARRAADAASATAHQVVQQTAHYLETTNWPCVAQHTGTGLEAGVASATTVSAIGLATGAVDLVISPTAYATMSLGGAGAGFASGLASCGGSFMARSAGGGRTSMGWKSIMFGTRLPAL
jgi:RHS repeat-associated protein